jgi:hypothetical protein
MTDDELRDFVHGVCDNAIFTTGHMNDGEERLVPLVFLGLAFGDPLDEQVDTATLGCLWEYLHRARRHTVCGYPQFPASMRLMHIEDWVRAVVAIREERARRTTAVDVG